MKRNHGIQSAFRKSIAALIMLAALASAAGAQEAVSGPSRPASSSIFDFPGKAEYHMTAGWVSTGFLFAAGAVGAARALDLMARGHKIRKTLGIDDEDDPAIEGALADLYADGQALRWIHVGLLAAGEALYVGNAVTGLSMKLPLGERTRRADIHLTAFFIHAGMMAGEAILGVLTSDALRRGDHEAHLGLTLAHAAIGVAIPIVMAGAGLAETADIAFLQSP
jgi:hypothetical protein